MKRALIIILTTFAFVACSKDDVVMEYRGEAIDFNASTGNITRAEDDKSYTENVPQFHVWGYYTNGATSAIKMKDVLVKKSGDSWSYDNIQYWPKDGVIDFIAINPTATEVAAGQYKDHRTGQDLVAISHDGFATGANRKVTVTAKRKDASMHYSPYLPDLIYSVTEDQSRQATAVQMHFRHAMTQVKCKVKNENEDFLLEFLPHCAVEIHNVKSKGTFTLPAYTTVIDSTDDKTFGTWSVAADDFASFDIFTQANPKINGFETLTGDPKRAGYIDTGYFMDTSKPSAMFIPCNVPEWDETKGAASAQNGAYFVVYCRVSYQMGTMNKRYYLLGDKDEANNIDRYEAIYAPVTIDWKPGYCYIYTFTFGQGIGYTEDGKPSAVPLSFSVEATPYEYPDPIDKYL